MRKVILNFLLVLLLLAIVTLAYGFYNAKKIRNFSKNAQSIEKKYDFDGELQEIEKYFNGSSSNQDAKSIQEDAAGYQTRLETLAKKTAAAGTEAKSLSSSKITDPIRQDLEDYYKKAGSQAKDISALIVFMNQIYGVSAVFHDIGGGATLDDIKNMISDAQNKSDSLSADSLPQNLKGEGSQLTDSTKKFLASLQKVATEKKDEAQALEGAYAEFSKNEDQFSTGAEKFIAQMENLGPLRNKIDSELPKLGTVYFSLK